MPSFNLNYFCFFLIFKFYFIFKLYIIVLVLPNIKMNPSQVYMCSPSWTLLPSPSPYHPSGSSQCTSPKHPVSCIEWSTISLEAPSPYASTKGLGINILIWGDLDVSPWHKPQMDKKFYCTKISNKTKNYENCTINPDF